MPASSTPPGSAEPVRPAPPLALPTSTPGFPGTAMSSVPGIPLAAQRKPIIRFPARNANSPTLVLPKRRSAVTESPAGQALVNASEEARRSIEKLVNTTRAPWGDSGQFSSAQIEETQRLMRDLENKIQERERLIADLEGRLAERERDLAEAEALLVARERVIEAGNRSGKGQLAEGACSPEERAALDALKAELDRQEAFVREQKAMNAERERFVEENENRLFTKMQEQQEKETMLEQLAEELALKESRLNGTLVESTKTTPNVERDEFNE